MWKLRGIIIVSLLLISSLGLPLGFNEQNKESNLPETQIINPEITPTSEESGNEIESRGTGIHRQTNACGGSWLDSFEDDSKIDWVMSDNFYKDNNNIIIDIRPQLDSNTIGLWRFDEASGTTIYDETTNNYDGTVQGANWRLGKFASALHFDGIDDYVNLNSHASAFSAYSIGTIEMWFKWNYSSTTTGHHLFNLGDYSTTRDLVQLMLGESTGSFNDESIQFVVRKSDSYRLAFHVRKGHYYYRDGIWHHLSIVIGTNFNEIYIDGIKQMVTYMAGGPTIGGYFLNVNNADRMVIGRRDVSGLSSGFFDGYIDEVRISNIPRKPQKCYINFVSKSINSPTDMNWDTLLINKTQPANTYINITILNSTNNQPIPGSLTYTENDEFDISYINSKIYPSIKLSAIFEGNGITTPILHSWGVSWNASNTWHDTFFGGQKVESSVDVVGIDGNAELDKVVYDPGAVAYWPFNEGSGFVAIDQTSNKNDGTIYGASYSNGKFGKALSFDGVDDHVDVSDSTSLKITGNQITIEAWIKINSYANSETQVICKGEDDNWIWGISVRDTGSIRLLVYSNNNDYFDSNTVLSLNKWFYVVVRYNGTHKTIFIDAKKEGEKAATGNIIERANDKSIYIGDRVGSMYDLFFDGIIDDLAIYNRALSIQEIKDHFENRTLNYPQVGYLTSKPIIIPDDHYWGTLIINRTKPANTYLNYSVLDAISSQPIPYYSYQTGSTKDLSSLDPKIYSAIKLQATFESNGSVTPILHDWSVNWTKNRVPRVLDISPAKTVYRTNTIQLAINLSDHEDSEDNLTLDIDYKSPFDGSWQSEFITEPIYSLAQACWECSFSPSRTADLGDYSFRVTINDSFQFFNITIYSGLMEVLNNIPTAPDVYIPPNAPKTRDELTVIAENSTDVERVDPLSKIDYWYRWFKNDTYLPAFDNETLITSTETQKGETWRCVAYHFDGDDLGLPGSAEVEIQNSPPELFVPLATLEMFEDQELVDEDLLSTMFADPDNDALIYSFDGQDKLNVEIFQTNGTIRLTPEPDWFGVEMITFYANDTFSSAAFKTVIINVKPTNDLPRIVQVGNQPVKPDGSELRFIVNQDQWLNLTIVVEDIDGDVERGLVEYLINETTRANLYLSTIEPELVFHPTNADVGVLYLNISISDNNETPMILISQKIRIEVLNINDPPSVKITKPTSGAEFLETEDIEFSCVADDIDLLIPNSMENFLYLWSSNITKFGLLGIDKNIIVTNKTLPPGYYNISVMVQDADGKTAYDFIEIIIKEVPVKPKEKTEMSIFEYYGWLLVLLAIIILIVIIIAFFLAKRKKSREMPISPGEQVLQPDAAYQPEVSLVTLAQASGPTGLLTAQGPQPQTAQIPSPSQEPSPVLAPTQIGVQTQYPSVEPTMAESDITITVPSTGLPTIETVPQLPPAEQPPTPTAQPPTPTVQPEVPVVTPMPLPETEPEQAPQQEPSTEFTPVPEPVLEPTIVPPPTDLPPDAYVQPEPTQPETQQPHQIEASESPLPPQQPTVQQTAPKIQPQITLCPHCQQQIQEHTKSCPHCGSVLNSG
jgi:hypothetical protein